MVNNLKNWVAKEQKYLKIAAVAILLGSLSFVFSAYMNASREEAVEKKAKINEKSIAYAFGLMVGTDLRTKGFTAKELNLDDLMAGIRAGLGIDSPALDVSAARFMVEQGFQEQQQKLIEKNKQGGILFLQENAKKKSVIQTSSGLQYEILKSSTGAKPNVNSKVTVHYHGTLLSGLVFDSSVERGEPASFPLAALIKGWQEGIQLMNAGSRFKFYIPSELAYGDKPAGKIPPFSVIVFEVELLSIEN